MSVIGAPGTASPITLNAVVPGFLTFAGAGAINGRLYRYAIREGNRREVCSGIYTSAGTTLTRVTHSSTAGGTTPETFTSAAIVSSIASAEDFADPRAGAISVDRNGVDQTGLVSNVSNKIQFTNEVFDIDSWFDNATDFRYTPLVPGQYLIIVGCSPFVGTAGESGQAQIWKNGIYIIGGQYLQVSSVPTGNNFISVATGVVNMNGTTDFIEGYAYVAQGSTGLSGGTNRTYMSGVRIH